MSTSPPSTTNSALRKPSSARSSCDVAGLSTKSASRCLTNPSAKPTIPRLIARFYFESADYLESLFEQEFCEVIRRFEQAFARALPDLPISELCWRMHFTAGVMVHTMLDSGRTHKWAPQAITDATDQETLDAMVRFVAGGMRAAADAARAPSECGAPEAEVVRT